MYMTKQRMCVSLIGNMICSQIRIEQYKYDIKSLTQKEIQQIPINNAKKHPKNEYGSRYVRISGTVMICRKEGVCIFGDFLQIAQSIIFNSSNPMTERKAWTPNEDQALKELYENRGIKKWAEISRILHKQFKIQNRSGKQCRERYHNHLDSAIKHQKWSQAEEAQLMALQEQVGNRWAQISRSITGRSQNCVKNQFYSILRRGLRKINSIIRSRLKRYKQLQINILYKIVQSSQNTETDSVQSNSYSLKKEIAYYGMSNEDIQDYDLKRVKEVIEKIKGFGKVAPSKKKQATVKREDTQRFSEDIQSSEYRDNFPVSTDKETKELKPRRNSLYSFHLQKVDQKNEDEAAELNNLCSAAALMPQNNLMLRKTSLSNLSIEGVSPRYEVTSPKCFDIFAPEGQGEHTQNSFKSPSTGLICESPYFDQLRPGLYSTWYNLYPH